MRFAYCRSRKILGPRFGRYKFPRTPDRIEREPLRDEIEDLRHTATHHVRFWRATVRPHSRMLGQVHEGGETHEGKTRSGFHLQLPVAAIGLDEGHTEVVDERFQLFGRRW